MSDYEKFLVWFNKRWPEFPHPLNSAFECYQQGMIDEKITGSPELKALRELCGYGSQGSGKGRDNKHREVLWVSPNCLVPVSDVIKDFDESDEL